MNFELRDYFSDAEIVANGSFSNFSNPDSSDKDSIVFCIDYENLNKSLINDNVSCIITSKELLGLLANYNKAVGLVISNSPRDAYWRLFAFLVKSKILFPKVEFGIDEGVDIHPSAIISDNVFIGKNTIIGEGVIVNSYSRIGEGCSIHSGAVIGADGMQLYKDNGKLVHLKHAGGVYLESGVTVLANSVISKGVYPVFTRIKENTCISLMVSVGHEAEIGENCRIAGNVLIGGSVRIGDSVVIGPSATIKDGLVIGNNSMIRMGSVVIADVHDNEDVSGNFAYSHVKNLKNYARYSRF